MPEVAEATALETPAGTPAEVVAPPVVPAVPEKYDLKLPEGSTVDAAIVERTAARARVLGLTNEAGQKLLDAEVEDAVTREKSLTATIATERTAAVEALTTAWAPGGAERTKRDAAWKAAAMLDPDVVGTTATPEAFQQAVERGQQALKKWGSPELEALLVETGFAFQPKVIAFLKNVGKAMGESAMANGGSPTGGGPKSVVNKFYGNSTPEPE